MECLARCSVKWSPEMKPLGGVGGYNHAIFKLVFDRLLKINVRAKLADIRYRSSARVLARELESSRYAYVFDDEDLSQHYGDQPLDDPGLQNITKTFILERIDFIEQCLGKEEIAQAISFLPDNIIVIDHH